MSGRIPESSRRDALRLLGGVAIVGLGSACEAIVHQALPVPGASPDDGALDEALKRLHDGEPESPQGLSTHAPMVAEALCSLGRSGRAVAWVGAYRRPLLRLPGPRTRIDPRNWRDALGPRPASSWEESLERWGDWRVFFTAELSEAPWRVVLDTWAGRLAPGLCAAATHGVIRTAHAARALGRRETGERRAELARGLAYWASAYQELPARDEHVPAAADYGQALERLPLYRDTHGSVPPGNIVNGLREAGSLPGFAGARDLVTPATDLEASLSELTRTAARAYLRHGTQGPPVAAIAFVHAVTAPTALRRLARHVRPETAQAALPYAWQAVAGIYTAYARRENPVRDAAPKLAPEDLVARAVDNGDEHAIKFTEALLSENQIRPDSAYLAAAEDAVQRL